MLPGLIASARIFSYRDKKLQFYTKREEKWMKKWGFKPVHKSLKRVRNDLMQEKCFHRDGRKKEVERDCLRRKEDGEIDKGLIPSRVQS